MAYLALAFKSMKLARLMKKANNSGWPEGENGGVKKALQEMYRPDKVAQ